MKVNYGEVLGKIGNGIVEGCKVAFCVGLLALPYLSTSNTKTTTYSSKVGYDDAVKAIVSSGMYSHDKADLIEVLKKNADSAYYSAVISIVKSGMYSHEKVDTITSISK